MVLESYYKEFNLTNTEFKNSPVINFGIIASKITIILDSSLNDIEWSYNGRDISGKMYWFDESIVLGGMTVSKLYLKADNNSGTKVRVWARL